MRPRRPQIPVDADDQQAVLRAIQRGIQQVIAIVRITGLDASVVRAAIKNLQDAGEIRRKDLGGYKAVIRNCLLADVWR